MGDSLSSLFIDPTRLEGPPGAQLCQLLLLVGAYGFAIFKASELISDGSELLLLTKYARLVGSVVLPVLGAVPDAMIVLFSGMGKNIHRKIEVGVGDLAGSTIMLLTVPWFFAVLGGRVDMDENGEGNYASRVKLHRRRHANCGLCTTGVSPMPEVRAGGIAMALTSVPYALI